MMLTVSARAACNRLLMGCLALFLLTALSLSLGEYRMTLRAVLAALAGHAYAAPDRVVVLMVRLPRLIVAMMTGCAFGISGMLLQRTLRNPLADPGLLGVNDGAGLFVTTLLVLFPKVSSAWTPVAAFVGAAVAALLLLLLSAKRRFEPRSVLLNGIGLSLFFYAVTKLIKTFGDWTLVQNAIEWLQGNLTGVSWPQVWLLLPWFLLAVPAAVLLAKLLGPHSLGDELAISLGSRPRRERLLLLLLLAVLTGSAISVTGPVYFVGLIAGNMARAASPDPQRSIILAGLFGAALLAAADLAARLVIAPRELRLLFLVGLLGAPLLLWQLVRQGRLRSASHE